MKDKKETLDEKDDTLKFKKLAKKQRLQERGITLISLVVTIIILLILSGVTLNIALSDNGLFSKTKKAAEDYKEAQSEEEESIRQITTQLYSEYVGVTVEGYEPAENKEGVTIYGTTSGVSSKTGDSGIPITNKNIQEDGSQKFEADTNMSWRVWDFDGNILRIIGDPTTKELTLQGAAGYNNGVWAIDHICRTLYSNEEKGAIATNLKRTDIQKVSTYDYTKYKHKENDDNHLKEDTEDTDGNLIHFGESKTYDANNQYPEMWSKNDSNWRYEYSKDKGAIGRDKECKKWEIIGNEEMSEILSNGAASVEFKQSYYYHNYNQSEFMDNAYYDLIFRKNNAIDTEAFWLAGRYVDLYDDGSDFGLQIVLKNFDDTDVSGRGLFFSDRVVELEIICASPDSGDQSKER